MDEYRVLVFDNKHNIRTLKCAYFAIDDDAYQYSYDMFNKGYNVFIVKNYDEVILKLTNHSF